jgi:aspartyl-tRNA(Asn)/glutamyl-tRNA(Gln) amidotransferase subunit C
MSKPALTKENIVHLAKLANLKLTDEEIEKFKDQLGETLHYVENLHELDTKNVTPTNHTTNSKNVVFEDGEKCTRQFTQEEALKNAPQKKGNFFYVKRIME